MASTISAPSPTCLTECRCSHVFRKKGSFLPISTKLQLAASSDTSVISLIHCCLKRRKFKSRATQSPFSHPSNLSSFTGGNGGFKDKKSCSVKPDFTTRQEACTRVLTSIRMR
ncbi:hypothetical protein MARINOS108_140045 [Marinoscillum sp. 108]|nr:hypothetical protein MARINOS108_140045 [Marinoscillum sp. 108]